MRSKNKNYHSQFLFEELEPRQLFSGGIEGLIATELEPTIATYIDLDSSSELETTQQNILSTAAEQQTNEIVFVDTGVENYQALVDDILNNTDSTRKIDVVLLDSNQNGIEQISDTLLDHDELNAIHIISHGSDGNIQLGNTSLNTETLTENSLAIALWAESFAESGDILIYGCNLTETEVGKNLIKSISNLTQTDVAASDDLTGQQNLGGDWNLEFNTGTIESTVVISVKTQQSWGAVLADISSGLIGHWRFDTDATDSSGNNYNGTLQGNAAIDTSNATDQVGEGKLSLDGSDDYVDLSPHVGNFNGLTNGTISAWVNFSNTDDNTIFDIGDGAGQSNWVSFFVDNGKLQLTILDGGIMTLDVSSTASINDSTWHHVAFTSFPVGNALYIDGVQLTGGALTYLKGSSSSSTFIGDLNTTTNVTIGAFQDGSVEAEFQGLLDDVRLYNRALSSTDILELNSNQVPVITSDSGGITASVNMVENNTAVTTVTATDDDIDTLTYSINGGNDEAKFNINSSSGELTFVAAPDFETPTDVGGDGTYNVTVQADDGNGGIDIQAISVTVTNINEIPVLSNFGAAAAYTENDAPVALVPTATVIDVDNMNFDGGTLTT